MDWSADDYACMARALQLARRGMYSTHPNPRVGCVFVKNGRIIADGWHQVAGGPHAETHAISRAGEDLAGCDCYVTLEPCSHSGRTPPCTDALIKTGIHRLVAAINDPNPRVNGGGLLLLEQAGIETRVGLLADQARRLNAGYLMRMSSRRPLVRCKLAASMDGRTALANGESKWITGRQARLDVQRLRAASSALMTGIGTVLSDDPRLDVRDVDTSGRQPLRVVIDPDLRIPPASRILTGDGRTLVFTCRGNGAGHAALRGTAAEVVTLDPDGFLAAVLHYLAAREEINEILLEAGSRLAGSMLQEGFIDELILYQAPVLLGDSALGLFHLPEISAMAGKIELQFVASVRIGADIRSTYTVKPAR